MERKGNLTAAAGALVNGQSVGVVQEAGEADWLPQPRPLHITLYDDLESLRVAAPQAAVIITDRLVSEDVLGSLAAPVVYRPKTLAVGIGCNRNTPAEEIEQAVQAALSEAGLAQASIAVVASIDAKSNEDGLLAAAARSGWPLRFFTAAELSAVADLPNPSPWAQKALGVPGVSEPAALLAAGAGSLLVEKRRFPNVTVAVARVS